ncbi:MAG: serine/threonine-protein kinase [Planctomycetota bacterium]
MAAEVPVSVPGFTVLKKITDGGSASIFKAKKHPYDTIVALKVLLPQFEKNKDMVRAFDREAEMLTRLKHPNIVKSGGRVSGAPRPTIELELFESSTVKAFIAKKGGRLSVAEMAKILKPVAEALSYVHALDVAHLDIKPENILVDEKLQVRLIDFSIAKELKRSISERLRGIFGSGGSEGTVTIQGTLTYLAPEQIKRQDPGKPADVYALGLVLYECLTGGPPFRGHDPKALMKQHVSDPPPSLDGAPQDVQQLYKKMLEKDPAKRPDATSVAQVLAKHAG